LALALGALPQILEGPLGAVARGLDGGDLRLHLAPRLTLGGDPLAGLGGDAAKGLHRPFLQLGTDPVGAGLGHGDPLLADADPLQRLLGDAVHGLGGLTDGSQLPRWIAHSTASYYRHRRPLQAAPVASGAICASRILRRTAAPRARADRA